MLTDADDNENSFNEEKSSRRVFTKTNFQPESLAISFRFSSRNKIKIFFEFSRVYPSNKNKSISLLFIHERFFFFRSLLRTNSNYTTVFRKIKII